MEQTEEKTTTEIIQEPLPADGSEVPAVFPNAAPIVPPAAVMPEHPEHVLAGVIGAFLFSLLGGGLYFLIYQLGFLAGICGLAIIALSVLGYQIFSGRKNSMKGVITAIIMMIIVIFLAEYLCVSYEIYSVFQEEGYVVSFFSIVRTMPEFLTDPDLLRAVVFDLVLAYLLSAVAAFTYIRNALKTSRAIKKTKEAASSAAVDPWEIK